MNGGGWQKVIDWSYKIGLTGLVSLNLVAGLAVIGTDIVKPVLAQNEQQSSRTVSATASVVFVISRKTSRKSILKLAIKSTVPNPIGHNFKDQQNTAHA
jgi:hypothetical protein